MSCHKQALRYEHEPEANVLGMPEELYRGKALMEGIQEVLKKSSYFMDQRLDSLLDIADDTMKEHWLYENF